jgi:hypothetical protein
MLLKLKPDSFNFDCTFHPRLFLALDADSKIFLLFICSFESLFNSINNPVGSTTSFMSSYCRFKVILYVCARALFEAPPDFFFRI